MLSYTPSKCNLLLLVLTYVKKVIEPFVGEKQGGSKGPLIIATLEGDQKKCLALLETIIKI